MGLNITQSESPKFIAGKLGSWHANLIYINGKKCVLFVNDTTLFNFIVVGVKKAQIKELSKLFITLLSCTLSFESIPEVIKEEILNEYNEISYINTDNRSVLGSINDLAFHYKYLIQTEGGTSSPHIPHIISKLNHMPMGAIQYKYSIDALKELYEI